MPQDLRLLDLIDAFNNRIIKNLRPLLLSHLNRRLPLIYGESWFEELSFVLFKGRNSNLVPTDGLEQFDTYLLIRIYVGHYASLAGAADSANRKLLDSLYTIKDFRNEVEHVPDVGNRALLLQRIRQVLSSVHIVNHCLNPNREIDTEVKPEEVQAKGTELIDYLSSSRRPKTKSKWVMAIGVVTVALIAVIYTFYWQQPLVIEPSLAHQHIDKEVTVCGELAEVNVRTEGVSWLNFDRPYPENAFTAQIPDEHAKNFIGINLLLQQELCVKGVIQAIGGNKTMIQLKTTEQWVQND